MLERVLIVAINKMIHLGVLVLLSLAVCVPPLQAALAPASCTFGNQTVAHGDSVTAYQGELAMSGQTCVSETRTCNNGTLSGSYRFDSCRVACNFNGYMILPGDNVTAYQSDSVPYDQHCESESRTCDNGTMTGSYRYDSCTVGPAPCRYRDQIVAHGRSVTTYQSDSVPYGQRCESETRTCDNGVLSGSYNSDSCTVAPPSRCNFNGHMVDHGGNIGAYESNSVPYGQHCMNERRTCDNGMLTGSYMYLGCTVAPPSVCSFGDQTVPHGESVTAYHGSTSPPGGTCESETRTCDNGTLSGRYEHPTCTETPPSVCTFNGQTVDHGSSVTAYENNSPPAGQHCVSESRKCNNGTLSGNYIYSTCDETPDIITNDSPCGFNNAPLASGGSVTAYQSDSVPYGQTCESETRTCNNGTLSGSYEYPTCYEALPSSCSFNDNPVPHGTKITVYENDSVPYGQNCVSEDRVCDNGTLSGSYEYLFCTVADSSGTPTDAPCSFKGNPVPHGGNVTAYQSGSVPYGQTCVSEDRICQNGTLSGSYGYDSCTMEDEPLPIVDDPGTGTNIFCWFNGDQVSHGGSVTAYQSGTVPDGQTCVSETRTCNNGTLSGSYGYNSCTVEDGSDDDSGTTTDPGTTTGSSCSLDGNPVANGGSVTAYQSNHVPYGETCVSETRTCHNGTLSGSYGYDSCNPLPASHCVLYGKSVEHGTRVTAYDLPQARPGQPCVSEERVCNNGTLSGNYVYDSCTGEGGSDGDSGDDSGTDSGGDSTGTDGSSTTDSGTTNDSGTTTGNPPPLPEFDILAVPASFTLAGLWLARSKKRRSARKNRKQDS